ncbi:MAG: alpha/beta hydrolase [Bacteroidales bacterium]|nr:alpha/beta hydrolase [Bacteroidales bacterium]
MGTEIKTLSAGGSSMDCAIIGNGPRPLLMIPGMSLHKVTPQADAVAHAYRALLPDFTIYLLDRRDNPEPGCSVADLAGDAVAALEQIGVESACVLGPSQGGMIAMQLALEHPQAVKAMMLSSTIIRQSDTSRKVMRGWKELSALGSPEQLNRDVFRRVYSPEYYLRYARAFARLEGAGTPEEMRSFGIMADTVASFDISARVGEISCPVFVTGVENDTVLGGEGTADIVSALHCRSLVYPGSGHAAYDEDSTFPEKVKRFFDDSVLACAVADWQ